ncbi:MAG: 6-phosphofructokinase [Candidatus Berkiella sp.]
MPKKNILYAQSGGVTAVINATASGVISAARNQSELGKVYAARNGIIGALREELIDTSVLSNEVIAGLKYTPSGAFGSCRYKLKGIQENREEYERLISVFKAHNIGYFFYNGGGDSQDTAHKVSQLSQEMGFPITCIGIPKTVDNDLPFTDNCPGFGSVAKYVAISTLEASLDVASMCESSTKVFILEVMGRHAGWIAAASALAQKRSGGAPHIILFPEVVFDEEKFLDEVNKAVKQHGYCVIVASEGAKYADGQFLAQMGSKDAFGHVQLGGVAPMLANLIKSKLKLKYHWAVADYLQRAARHISSHTDVEHAFALGEAAVKLALENKNAVMPYIKRDSSSPYRWHIESVELSKVANVERTVPPEYISENGFGITEACREYLSPLIEGESYPSYQNGLPLYVRPTFTMLEKKLEQDFVVR